MAFTSDDRNAVLATLADEVRAKAEGRPYSEAVIFACEACLRANTRKIYGPPTYWWQKED